MVRDREAPGSNPGPPTNFEFRIRLLAGTARYPRKSGVTSQMLG